MRGKERTRRRRRKKRSSTCWNERGIREKGKMKPKNGFSKRKSKFV
jgi:hypothetical protein